MLSTEHVQNYGSSWWDEEARVADAIAKLNALYAKGIHTIVNPTVWGLGHIPRIQRDDDDAGQHHRRHRPVRLRGAAPAVRVPQGLLIDIPDPMVTDFSTTSPRASPPTPTSKRPSSRLLETAEPTPGVERITRAIAEAHLATGAPITVHTSGPHQGGRAAVRIFTEEGVNLSKVMIGHAGDSNDLDYLTELADQGVLLGMDRFGLDLFNPGAERIKTIAALAARGYAASMVLSTTPIASSITSARRTTRCAPRGRTELALPSTSATTCCPAPCLAGVTPRPRSTPCWWTTRCATFTPAKGGAA